MPAPRKAIALFLSLGLSSAPVCAGQDPTAAGLEPVVSQPVQGAMAGHGHASEGGEGGEGGSSATVSSDAELQLALAQMQGHLLIAAELLQRGEAAAAEPHVGHPVDELYGAVAPALAARGIPGFLDSLEALRQQVRLDPGATPVISARLAAAREAISRAELALPVAQRRDPASRLWLVRQLASTAAQEYAAAVDNGQVIERIEYQDARGFLLEAQRRLSADGGPGQAAGAAATVNAMLQGLPSAEPPPRLDLSPRQLEELQAKL